MKGSTTILCYVDATKEKITKKRLPERGLWSSAPLLSRSAIFVANPIAAMTIDLEQYMSKIFGTKIFLPIFVSIFATYLSSAAARTCLYALTASGT